MQLLLISTPETNNYLNVNNLLCLKPFISCTKLFVDNVKLDKAVSAQPQFPHP